MIAAAHILILEDEPIVGIALEDMLDELGAGRVWFAQRIEEAERMIAGERIELAILDVNVHGRPSYEIADELARRGIPYVFATGYGDLRHPARFRDVPTVAKPYGPNDIAAAVRALGLRPSADTA